MGLMDKVKAQAAVLADKAQTGVQQGQDKLAELQAGRQADHLLRELGAYAFLSERGRTPADAEAKVARLMIQLDAVEAGGTPVAPTPDASTVPPGGSVPHPGPDPTSDAEQAPPPAAEAPPATPAGGAIPKSGGGLPGQ